MWLIRWTIIVIVLLALLGFSLQNQTQKVHIFFGPYVTEDMPLYFALYISFALGVFVFFLISVYNLLQLKKELARQRRDNRRLREELDRLRNISIEEEISRELPETESEEGKE
jgi:uncharacterized integral membrane protein